MKTLLDIIAPRVYRDDQVTDAHACLSKIIIFFCALNSVRKMEIQRKAGAFWNFIRKSDYIVLKYGKVLQTDFKCLT